MHGPRERPQSLSLITIDLAAPALGASLLSSPFGAQPALLHQQVPSAASEEVLPVGR